LDILPTSTTSFLPPSSSSKGRLLFHRRPTRVAASVVRGGQEDHHRPISSTATSATVATSFASQRWGEGGMPNPLHPFVSILGNHHPCKIVLGSGGWVPKTFQSRVWQTAKTTLLISFILGFWLDVPFLDNLKNKHIQRKKKKMMVTTVHNLSFPASNAACGVYLAPSTIPNAGLGMYAGTDFETDEEFLPFGDSVVGIYDISVHHSGGKVLERFLWDEYTWNAKAMHMGDEGVQEVTVTSSGFGAAANCQLSIVNVVEYYPLMYLTPLHPSRDPGAGGFSNFHYRKATAKRNIQAGQELFVSCT
jgi:hypothetical protein